MQDQATEEEARQLLRALAAQIKPVMKAHGFSVNSLEEYEHNPVFAGRNWNNGETIGEFVNDVEMESSGELSRLGSLLEIVLRRPHGGFFHTSWLMSTLLHEVCQPACALPCDQHAQPIFVARTYQGMRIDPFSSIPSTRLNHDR